MGERLGRRGRLAVAPAVIRHHGGRAGELLRQVSPTPTIGDPGMQQHDDRTATSPAVGHQMGRSPGHEQWLTHDSSSLLIVSAPATPPPGPPSGTCRGRATSNPEVGRASHGYSWRR